MRLLPLRLGIAGCGQVFESCHLPAILAGKSWHWVAACEPLADRRRRLKARFPWVEVVATYDRLLDLQTIDAVLVATPPALHITQTMQAIERRLPVLVEKPLGLSAQPLPDLPLFATAASVQIGFNRRLKRSYQRLRLYLKRIPRCDIRSIEVILRHDPSRWQAVTDYLQSDARGGGLWDDVLSHQIDLVQWLVGHPVVAAKVTQTEGTLPNPGRIRYKLQLSSGVKVDCLAGHHHAFEELVAVHLNWYTILALPDGLLRVRRLPRPFLRLINCAGTYLHLARCRITGQASESAASYRRQLAAFAQAIRTEPRYDSETAKLTDGIDNVKIIQACRQSLAAGGQTIDAGPTKGSA